MMEIKQYTKNISVWEKQWNIICDELKGYGEITPKFEDIITETNSAFGHIIQQGVFDNLDKISVSPESIRQIWRFVKESDFEKLTESRFIPQPEYASLNRMNDKDRLYSYFSISYKDSANTDVVATGVREIRSKSNDDIWKCQFNIAKSYAELKIIDFSPECKIPKDEDGCAKFLLRKSVENYSVNKEKLTYWLLQILLQVFHDSNMFEPIDKNVDEAVQRAKYKPFHVICDYLERFGYNGLIYRSTVFPKGRCLTLFDTGYASCVFDTLEKVNVDKALKIK